MERDLIKGRTDAIASVDPLAVNKLLCQELNELPLDHRQEISEEIHGVKSSEAVSLRQSFNKCRLSTRKEREDVALSQFQDELDRYYSSVPNQTETNLFALGSGNPTQCSAYRYARDNGSELVKDRDFQLTFFGRGEEGSCPKKAAKRMLKYLEFIRQVYCKNDVLFRPITLSDLDEAIGSKTFMYEVAPIQILPLRDPSGRRILVQLRDIGPSSSPLGVRVSGFLIEYHSQEDFGWFRRTHLASTTTHFSFESVRHNAFISLHCAPSATSWYVLCSVFIRGSRGRYGFCFISTPHSSQFIQQQRKKRPTANARNNTSKIQCCSLVFPRGPSL